MAMVTHEVPEPETGTKEAAGAGVVVMPSVVIASAAGTAAHRIVRAHREIVLILPLLDAGIAMGAIGTLGSPKHKSRGSRDAIRPR